MSHAIATILAADHVIDDRRTPGNCCAYGLFDYADRFTGSDDKEYISGERGFYMESQLGGIMKAKKVSETDWSIDCLILEVAGDLRLVSTEQWSEFYDKVVDGQKFMPLQTTESGPEPDFKQQLIKGRKSQTLRTRRSPRSGRSIRRRI